jgi:hypothetical protein
MRQAISKDKITGVGECDLSGETAVAKLGAVSMNVGRVWRTD